MNRILNDTHILNQFFTWFVHGAQMFYANGGKVKAPDVVMMKVNKLVEERDPFIVFVRDTICITTDVNDFIPTEDLFNRYNQFIESEYANDKSVPTLNKVSFGRRIIKEGCTTGKIIKSKGRTYACCKYIEH
jgi:hypothetical protein